MGNLIEVYTLGWQRKNTALALTLVRYRGSSIIGVTRLLGRCIGDASGAQAGLALAAGSSHFDNTLVRNGQMCGLLNKGIAIAQYAGDAPFAAPAMQNGEVRMGL